MAAPRFEAMDPRGFGAPRNAELREAMRRGGWSNPALAAALGVRPALISVWRRDPRRAPPRGVLLAVAALDRGVRSGAAHAGALHAAMDRAGWSVRELADALSADPETVRRWRSGRVPPPPWAGLALAEAVHRAECGSARR